MFEQATHQEQRVVAVASTEASADFIAATLAVHGIRAATSVVDRAYPSITWAEGFQVAVADEDEDAARRLLRDLERDDVVEVDGT